MLPDTNYQDIFWAVYNSTCVDHETQKQVSYEMYPKLFHQ